METRDRARVTAAPRPVRLRRGDDFVELRMSPLSDKDISELDHWVQSEIVRVARSSLTAETTTAEREETMTLALREASGATWMSGVGAKMMSTVDGLCRLVWQSVKREHPDIGVVELRGMMFLPENVAEVRRTFDEVNLAGAEGRGEPPKGNRRGPRRGARSTAR